MSIEYSENTITKINLDLTGFLIENNFAYVGRCNCNNCYQEKYANKKILLKICRSRQTFSLIKNNHTYVSSEKLNKLIEALNKYLYGENY